MNLKRKIAAALAAVMAIGSVGVINLEARTYSTGQQPQGVQGEWIGHGVEHRLTDINAAVTGKPGVQTGRVAHGVDFVVSGSQLEHGTGEQLQIRLRIGGDGIWNYGVPGIVTNATRANVSVADSAAGRATANLGGAMGPNWGAGGTLPIPVATLPEITAADWSTIPATGGGFFNPNGTPGGGSGPSSHPGAQFWVDLLTPTAVPAGFSNYWAGDSTHVFRINNATRLISHYAVWDNTNHTFGSAWVSVPGYGINNLTADFAATGTAGTPAQWVPAILAELIADGKVPTGTPLSRIALLPLSDTQVVAYELPTDHLSGRIKPVAIVDITGYSAATHTWTPQVGTLPASVTNQIGAMLPDDFTVLPAGVDNQALIDVTVAPPALAGATTLNRPEWNTAFGVNADGILLERAVATWDHTDVVHNTVSGNDNRNSYKDWGSVIPIAQPGGTALASANLPTWINPGAQQWALPVLNGSTWILVGITEDTGTTATIPGTIATAASDGAPGTLGDRGLEVATATFAGTTGQLFFSLSSTTAGRDIAVSNPTGLPAHADVSYNTNIPLAGGGGGGSVDGRILQPTQSIGNIGTSAAPGRLTELKFTGRVHASAQLRNEIPFTIIFESANELVIRWDRADVLKYGAAQSVLRVPLAVQATGNGEITLEVMTAGSTISPALVGGANQTITGTGLGARLTVHGGVSVGMGTALIQDLRVTESGYGFRNDGDSSVRAFTLTLPHDYVWGRNVGGDNGLRVFGSGRASDFTNLQDRFEANGAPSRVGQFAGSNPISGMTGAPYMFRSTHPDTGQDRLHIVFGDASFTGTGVGEIRFQNLAVQHRNPANPVWATDLEITLSNRFGGGFRNSTTSDSLTLDVAANNGLWNVIAPANVVAFSLVNQGLTLHPTNNAAGEMKEVIAGRTYRSLPANNPNLMPTSVDQFDGVARRIRVEETVPGAALNRDLVFTLTDADGEVIPTAKIAAVQFNSGALGSAGQAGMMNYFDGNTLLHNAVPGLLNSDQPGIGNHHRIIGTNNITGDIHVMFSEDGHTVTVRGLRPNDTLHRRVWLEATFFLSTDVNYDADVYVTLTQVGPGIGGFDANFVHPSATLQLAEVNKVFDIESAPTNIPHRAQRIDVEDVVITERVAGALVRDRQIELAISEFGVPSTRTEFGFNPIAASDVKATGALNVGVLPVSLGDNRIRFGVTTPSTGNNPATLTFTNLDLFVNQAVPVGTYGVVARGSAILDNDASVINSRLGANANSNTPQWRRYGFGGLLFEPFANITMPGSEGIGGGAIVDPSVAQVTATQGSAVVTIDNRTVTMTNVHGQATPMFHENGTNFFPMRGIAQIYGSEHAVAWTFITANGTRTVDWAPGVEVEVTISLGGRVIVFTTGSTTFTVNGMANTMPTGQTPRNVGGTVFIPFAALGHALGVPVSWEGIGSDQQFFFNQPNRGTVVTLNGTDAGGAAATSETVDEDENGEDYVPNGDDAE